MVEYIDKDKFCHFLFKEIAHVEETQTDTEIPISLVLQSVVNEVKKFKSEDVQPVVKARWVYTNMSRLVCSNCGNPVAFSLKEDGWHHGDFCPNCGARMDGGDAQ